MPEYAICRSTAELDALRDRWKSLWLEDPNATPFQSPEWLVPWWHHFGETELLVLAVSEKSRLLALLPFYVYPEPVSRERRLLLLGAGTSDYLDGVFSPGCNPGHISAALDHLRQETSWDIAHIPQLRPHSPLAEALCRAQAMPLASESCWRRSAASSDDLPKKLRHNLRYYRRLAQRHGTPEFSLAEPDEWRAALDTLHRLHTARRRTRGEPGVVADPRVSAWHRESVPQMLAAGLARLWMFHLNGEVAAAVFTLCDPPTRSFAGIARAEYFYLFGFDPRYAAFSPGSLLIAYAIDRACSEGVVHMDFLRGAEDYKKLWGTSPVATAGFALPRLPAAAAIAA